MVVEFFTHICKLRWPFLLFKKANIGTGRSRVQFFKCVHTNSCCFTKGCGPTDLPHSLGSEWLWYMATSVPGPEFCSFILVAEIRKEEALLLGEVSLALLWQECKTSSLSECSGPSAGNIHRYDSFVWPAILVVEVVLPLLTKLQ